MRILITADLHYRPAERAAYVAFAESLRAAEPDCFIIAGDVGHPLRLFRKTLQLFRDMPCPRLLVAGNHDVYRGEYSSQDLWQTQLPQATHEEGFIWLEAQRFTLGRLGICGTMAWYDYSSRSPHLPHTAADYRTLKGQMNHDADYVDWPWSDVAMARYLARGLARRLDACEADPVVEHVLVVTHMPIIAHAIPDYPAHSRWSLLRAYLGNLTLGDLVVGYRKVTHIVSGHLHRPGAWTVDGRHGPISCHVVGGGPGALQALCLEIV
ncbi:metallophosphoesterase [Oscillochloris sp. ZM17-4]|uniref:metallophosphoesterase n=1 Tax=Oscillochloris sp. ZM17-4 TaxID=2866714 RepID=UPI001C72B009|nr:metallophosphoesterase [Oscillochloris sp. ZM17-4]MBX0330235.1 metallophosphoesterase [Oscillochloris sp. ZM17-4]